MKRSTRRILTTHAGSLIRPPGIIEVLRAEHSNEEYDKEAFHAALQEGVTEVVAKQRQSGIDVPSDGEFGKVGWTAYVLERIEGITAVPLERPAEVIRGKDRTDFAEFYATWGEVERTVWLPKATQSAEPIPQVRWACTGKLSYKGGEAIARDIGNFKTALAKIGVDEGFLPVVAPGSVEPSHKNEFYATDEEYVYALANALRVEYQAIVDAGLLLQVDDAFMPALYDRYFSQSGSMEEFQAFSRLRIEALNHALRGIPEDRIRYHICWGSWNGPHSTDIPLREIVDLVLSVNAGGYSIEAANPRHEHEWQVWEDVKFPDGKVLIPGVVTHSTNIVEHPDLVAWRISNFARLVGRENVIAGTDCGFSQNWNLIRTHESIQWAKLRSLSEGAKRASQQLWA